MLVDAQHNYHGSYYDKVLKIIVTKMLCSCIIWNTKVVCKMQNLLLLVPVYHFCSLCSSYSLSYIFLKFQSQIIASPKRTETGWPYFLVV